MYISICIHLYVSLYVVRTILNKGKIVGPSLELTRLDKWVYTIYIYYIYTWAVLYISTYTLYHIHYIHCNLCLILYTHYPYLYPCHSPHNRIVHTLDSIRTCYQAAGREDHPKASESYQQGKNISYQLNHVSIYTLYWLCIESV